QLNATPRDADGNAVTGRTITWSSSNSSVASVSSSGSVSGLAQGTAVITATSEGISSTADITVSPLEPDTVVVSPTAVSIQPKQTAQLSASVRNSEGQSMSTTVSWSSGDPSLATVSGTGLVTGVSTGTTTVTASAGKKKTKIKVTVAGVLAASVAIAPSSVSLTQGATAQLSTTVKDTSGNVLTGMIVTWSSSNTNVATVSSSGLVTALAAGNATITATPGDSTGTALGGRTITWSSSNTSVAKVSSSGLVTAVAVGSATISSTSEG